MTVAATYMGRSYMRIELISLAGILISLLALAGYAGFLIWDIRIRKVQKMENPA